MMYTEGASRRRIDYFKFVGLVIVIITRCLLIVIITLKTRVQLEQTLKETLSNTEKQPNSVIITVRFLFLV